MNTNILCPDCMSGQLLTEDNKEAHCEKCKTEFVILAPMMVRYKSKEVKEPDRTGMNLNKFGIPNITGKILKW